MPGMSEDQKSRLAKAMNEILDVAVEQGSQIAINVDGSGKRCYSAIQIPKGYHKSGVPIGYGIPEIYNLEIVRCTKEEG